MEWFGTTDYDFAREVLQRGVAAIFVVAFLSTLFQFPALLGERGLLPVDRYLTRSIARRQPTIFRWRYSDRMLRALCIVGIVFGLALVAGLPQLGPAWVPLVCFLVMWALYLSIVCVGQTFYAFGWESLLLEAGFIVAWLGSNETASPIAVIFFVRWLVFRMEFGAGMIKMRGDRSWRDLTALMYHHETQPMPGPLSRYAHLLPGWVHRLEVLGNHFAQLVVPWFLFAPQPIASFAAAFIIATQLWLVVTGNFAWLNWLTIVLAFAAIDDAVVHALIPAWPTEAGPDAMPLWWGIPVLLVVILLVVLSWHPARNLVARRQLMNASFNRFHLVNAYGAFGSVSQVRYEVIVEGTQAEYPDQASEWRAYEFHGKPGDPARVPRQFAPYHLRLDWLMWFLALGSPDDAWFDVLLRRLLEADRPTLRLLRIDPFRGERPRWVRATVYVYRFSTHEEHRRTRLIWIRDPVAVSHPPRRLAAR
ncbi:lipase maturation factor family protein [Salinibacterium sp. ZJ77]|uniref:lipase maturation factor family protein n=1 Tax=Salinibacterium sp. ZJ77 TaxID=2708337 RepID=UPI00141F65B5|nr:lipase maturation factor family protein [Salinibacterium sp. ZJ77]